MEEKIKDFDAWVARDECGQLCVYFYDKPIKNTIRHRWDPTGREEFRYIDYVDSDKFPQVKWEDEEPTKVELTIKICENTKTLFEILPDFLNGKKIRRASWNQNLWLETTDGTLARLMIKEDSGIRLLHIGEEFSLDDVKAKDWEIVP